ncbi:hypothetical protein V5799_021886 [Amblyomma americanum]|uniref:Uncharacterized protein n=1 Tax=Amblyomma americanum TaxID=6943 RepID=A0AAQ4FP36_AMBAM
MCSTGPCIKKHLGSYTQTTESCAVLNSTSLGAQLWVRRKDLLEGKEMPYLCSLTYNLATKDSGVRYVVYDWKHCPARRSNHENLSHDYGQYPA